MDKKRMAEIYDAARQRLEAKCKELEERVADFDKVMLSFVKANEATRDALARFQVKARCYEKALEFIFSINIDDGTTDIFQEAEASMKDGKFYICGECGAPISEYSDECWNCTSERQVKMAKEEEA